ncbi:peptide-methionine (R)-S-oxide reductase MsrB [Paracoccus aestuariivivens]|uniref:peptide-methionine (R)-S-oxide reductase n=1 Tax=Paracoccus aestuariivivens TaxID=1820333 RepID=A0A6L6JDI6_9RHOB|nr:peptide-methionine (R)-S-oxide reductase MsrB [Paracoccus aestuariivivens]MTH80172.1 peptide-methionine (R)-S-oxide reductase MsrB [Paracoccus aestuariivivens]
MFTRRQMLIGGTAFALAGPALFVSGVEAASFAVTHSEAEWRAILTPEQFDVLRRDGTEYPGSSPLLQEHRNGIFSCAGCGRDLFSSRTKYDSGTGWPSFWAPLQGAVITVQDKSLGMVRVEVRCTRCGGHLGHVFKDGPQPTGLRYCMNGIAMTFRPIAS